MKEPQTTYTAQPGFADTMRADIAKAALQGLLSNPEWVSSKMAIARQECGRDIDAATICLKRELVEDAVEIADEMVRQLTGNGNADSLPQT